MKNRPKTGAVCVPLTGNTPPVPERHCFAERRSRGDVGRARLHSEASSGPASGRTMGLCAARVGVLAIERAVTQREGSSFWRNVHPKI